MRAGFPQGVLDDERILLADNGTFTSLNEASNDQVYYNDSDDLANALRETNPGILFFDCGQKGHSLFQKLSVPKLTENLEHINDKTEREMKPPESITDLFKRLRSSEVVNGIQCILEQNQQLALCKRKDCGEKIIALKDVRLTEKISSLYQFKGQSNTFQIERGCRVIDNVLFISSKLKPSEISMEVSKSISELIVDTRDAQSLVMFTLKTFLDGVDVKKVLALQKYTYEESIEVPELDEDSGDNTGSDENTEKTVTKPLAEEQDTVTEGDSVQKEDEAEEKLPKKSDNDTQTSRDEDKRGKGQPSDTRPKRQATSNDETNGNDQEPTLGELLEKGRDRGQESQDESWKDEPSDTTPPEDTPSQPISTPIISEYRYSPKSQSVRQVTVTNVRFAFAKSNRKILLTLNLMLFGQSTEKE